MQSGTKYFVGIARIESKLDRILLMAIQLNWYLPDLRLPTDYRGFVMKIINLVFIRVYHARKAAGFD